MTESRPRQAIKARLHDALQKPGYGLALADQTAAPLVQWFHKGCRKRILRLYLTPDGWVIVGEQFTETLDEWLKRSGLSRTAYEKSIVFNAQRVVGIERLLSLDFDEWPDVSFEIGCARHKLGYVSLEVLKSDAQEARAARRSKTRSLNVDDLV